MHRIRLRRLAEIILRNQPQSFESWIDGRHGCALATAIGSSVAREAEPVVGALLPATVSDRLSEAVSGGADAVSLGGWFLLTGSRRNMDDRMADRPDDDAPLSDWIRWAGWRLVEDAA